SFLSRVNSTGPCAIALPATPATIPGEAGAGTGATAPRLTLERDFTSGLAAAKNPLRGAADAVAEAASSAAESDFWAFGFDSYTSNCFSDSADGDCGMGTVTSTSFFAAAGAGCGGRRQKTAPPTPPTHTAAAGAVRDAWRNRTALPTTTRHAAAAPQRRTPQENQGTCLAGVVSVSEGN